MKQDAVIGTDTYAYLDDSQRGQFVWNADKKVLESIQSGREIWL